MPCRACAIIGRTFGYVRYGRRRHGRPLTFGSGSPRAPQVGVLWPVRSAKFGSARYGSGRLIGIMVPFGGLVGNVRFFIAAAGFGSALCLKLSAGARFGGVTRVQRFCKVRFGGP